MVVSGGVAQSEEETRTGQSRTRAAAPRMQRTHLKGLGGCEPVEGLGKERATPRRSIYVGGPPVSEVPGSHWHQDGGTSGSAHPPREEVGTRARPAMAGAVTS